MKITYKFLIPMLFIFVHIQSYAQQSYVDFEFDFTKTYIFTLIDESELIGKYVSKDLLHVSIATSDTPKISIPFSELKKIKILANELGQNNKYSYPNPSATRYLIGPSAFALKKGKGYYQGTYLLLNSFNYGLTDHISIGGGFELFSILIKQNPIFFITSKIAFPVGEKINLGAGINYLSTPDFDEEYHRNSFGIAYGIGTYGTPDHNITGGIGWGFIKNELSANPIITFSGTTRLSKRFALVSENWIAPVAYYKSKGSAAYIGLYSYGVRYFEKKVAVDFAFINNKFNSENRIGFPYLDFVVNF